jgi:pyruvate ferredoxin oxidoreductase gamma subunit
MIEIRIHGRGGQGVVTFAELLAEAAWLDGWQVRAFPSFGVERRGGPIMSFVRLDKKPILLHSQVYQPNFLIIQDPSLLGIKSILAGTTKDTLVLINNDQSVKISGVKVKTVPATQISLQALGKPIVNTAMLGAWAGLTKLIKLLSVKQAISRHFSGEVQKKNLLAAETAWCQVDPANRRTTKNLSGNNSA